MTQRVCVCGHLELDHRSALTQFSPLEGGTPPPRGVCVMYLECGCTMFREAEEKS